jgi:hypothetical protein
MNEVFEIPRREFPLLRSSFRASQARTSEIAAYIWKTPSLTSRLFRQIERNLQSYTFHQECLRSRICVRPDVWVQLGYQ